MTSKAQLRKEIDDKRRALDSGWVKTASLSVAEHLQRLKAFRSARWIALYKAIAGEVDLDCLFAACWKSGQHTCIPVFNRHLKTYELAETTAETQYISGKYGIQEPVDPSGVPIDAVDLIIVPGVAFDAGGNRLGRGGGYYDRLLTGFNGTRVAAAFDFQVFSHIPHESYDIPVTSIVTESKIIDVCNER